MSQVVEERIQQLKDRLQALSPTTLEVIDESHHHIGHEGAKDGASHFRLRIASEQFSGKNTLACHRLIYAEVGDLIPFPVHALAIEILS
ncbi:MAG TPA: BolA family protein [Paenalcaligenes sp.]|nr:BolA family protein [Paenalcaligenes sp.]